MSTTKKHQENICKLYKKTSCFAVLNLKRAFQTLSWFSFRFPHQRIFTRVVFTPSFCQEAYMLWGKWDFFLESTKYKNLFRHKIFLFIFSKYFSDWDTKWTTLAVLSKWEVDPAANNFLARPVYLEEKYSHIWRRNTSHIWKRNTSHIWKRNTSHIWKRNTSRVVEMRSWSSSK